MVLEDHRVVLMRWNKNQKNTKKCSGRDLNPGSATRKAAMLDRTVQPYRRRRLLHHRSIRKLCKNLPIKSFLARFHKVFLLEREMRSLIWTTLFRGSTQKSKSAACSSTLSTR